MKAVICTAYGPPEVLQVRSVPDPRPGRKEVCIRLVATAVTASDAIVRGLKLRGRYRPLMRIAFGWRAPRRGIIGMIASGRIESVGRDVKAFKEGDEVFGMDGFRAGTYAEKVCWPASTQLALKPSNLNFEEAAALPYGGLLASFFLRRLKVGAGRRVLIYGASGAIGTAAVQLARHLGAEVTGVCSTGNL
ncbi:MAG: NAD(P)-dependent alcohol dehydrogenase, partial [Chloroflexi bacterium]